jgi:hypothetical protein
MVKKFMSGKNKFALSKLLVEEFNKSGMSADKFAVYASQKLGFTCPVYTVRSLLQALEIPANPVQHHARASTAIAYIDKALASIEQRLIARIEESEKLLAVLEIRVDVLRDHASGKHTTTLAHPHTQNGSAAQLPAPTVSLHG